MKKKYEETETNCEDTYLSNGWAVSLDWEVPHSKRVSTAKWLISVLALSSYGWFLYNIHLSVESLHCMILSCFFISIKCFLYLNRYCEDDSFFRQAYLLGNFLLRNRQHSCKIPTK